MALLAAIRKLQQSVYIALSSEYETFTHDILALSVSDEIKVLLENIEELNETDPAIVTFM